MTDSLSHTSDATITVGAALTITPSTAVTIKNGTIDFDAANGVGPYTFAMNLGGGSVVAGTGVYTAPNATGTAIVRVTDSLGNFADGTITINDALAISPSSKVMVVNGNFTFSASGGIPPYTFSKFSGDGAMAAGGAYTAAATSGSAVVRVTDSASATSDATVTINELSVLVRSDGNFFDQVMLEPGVNKITVTATSRFGKVSTITRDVGYQPD